MTPQPSHVDRARARLAEQRRVAAQRVEELTGWFDAMVEAASDVATDDEHDPEGHTIAWERQQIAALLTDGQRTIADIEAAEHRIADGTYGRCTVCRQAISSERLVALPATPSCITCADAGNAAT